MLAERHPDRRYPLAYQPGRPQVIAVEGELDLGTVHRLERAIAGPEPSHRMIVIDLTAVAWISNPQLVALCGALRSLHRRGASVSIVGADPRIRGVLDAVELPGLVFRSTLRDALTAVEPDAPALPAARRPSRFSLPAAGRQSSS